MTDAQLAARILAGDAAAERLLYDRHVERVWRLACRMTGDAALAEDAVQDTFIRAFDRLADYRGDGPLAGWLHRIATTVVLGHLRRRKRLQSHELPHEDLAALPAGSPPRDPDLRRRLDRAVASLDENHRLVFVMHDLEGYTHQEIAAAMGTPVGTAKARLSRARARLRDLLLGPGQGPLAAARTD